jgi:hypothetical protein
MPARAAFPLSVALLSTVSSFSPAVARPRPIPVLQVNLNDSCRGPTVNMPFEVDIPAFEVAIVNAMDHIG